jgi:signal transduction histidine kinase
MIVKRSASVASESPLQLPLVPEARGFLERLVLIVGIGAIASLVVTAASDGGPLFAFLSLAVGVASICWFHLRNLTLQRELRSARVRALDATDVERHRIQRDLHDSAQQRLVSVRIHLGLLSEREAEPDQRAIIDELGRDIEVALADLRSVTSDGSPEILLRNGVVESLLSVAARAPMRVTIETDRFERYAPRIERAVYFSCLEALQNVLKHAGPKANARIRLQGRRHRVTFVVEDTGIGFDPASVWSGTGLISIKDRVRVLGGHLTIDSLPGLGTKVVGRIPITASPRESSG